MYLKQCTIVSRVRNDVIKLIVVALITHLKNYVFGLQIFDYVLNQKAVVYYFHSPFVCLLLLYKVRVVENVVINTDCEDFFVETLELHYVLLVLGEVLLFGLDDAFCTRLSLRNILLVNQVASVHDQRRDPTKVHKLFHSTSRVKATFRCFLFESPSKTLLWLTLFLHLLI